MISGLFSWSPTHIALSRKPPWRSTLGWCPAAAGTLNVTTTLLLEVASDDFFLVQFDSQIVQFHSPCSRMFLRPQASSTARISSSAKNPVLWTGTRPAPRIGEHHEMGR